MSPKPQMLLDALAAKQLAFSDVLAHIDARFTFTPTAFDNGAVHNKAGQNNGACRVFAFAQEEGLTPEQTLALFAEHYASVLATPAGIDHANIRAFMDRGWAGLRFAQRPLALRV